MYIFEAKYKKYTILLMELSWERYEVLTNKLAAKMYFESKTIQKEGI